MRRMRVAPLIAVVALLVSALAGCTEVMERFARELPTSTSAETPESGPDRDAVAAAARPSVVKIHAPASSCQKLIEGTGFVAAPNRVLTAAHVVAGSDTVTVDADGAEFDAQVVSYDPNTDIAIIDVPGMSAAPLSLAGSPATTGTDALALGYPDAGSFTVVPAHVLGIIRLNGPDIYRTTEVTRQVYVFEMAAGTSLQGVSGGPLIDMNGRVLGVVFGKDVNDRTTGFAFTSEQVAPQLAAIDSTEPVATGACIS